MRIGFCSVDWGRSADGTEIWPGGANWIRLQGPGRALAAAGHEVQIGTAIGVDGTTDQMLILGRDQMPLGDAPEIVVLQRWMSADAPAVITAARAAGQVVISDVDDWFEGLHPSNQAFASSHPKNRPDDNRNHYRRSLAASSLLVCSTEFLAERYGALLNRPTVVVRNALDLTDFVAQPVRDTREGLIVGWVGGVNWRSGDLETVGGPLRQWLRANGGKFVHHGATPNQQDHPANLMGFDMDVDYDLLAPSRPLMPPTEYVKGLLNGFDIGIVPLAPVPFNEAKSWIKGLEYAAAGIPFAASRTVEYAALGAGITVRRPRDWTRAFDLLADPANRRGYAERGLRVAASHDLALRWVDWEKAYSDALRRA